MRLPVSLEYELGPSAYMASLAVSTGRSPSRRFLTLLLTYWPWFAGLAIGLWCAVRGGDVFLGSMILAVIGYMIWSTKRSVEVPPADYRANRNTRLDLTENGMTGHSEEGVQTIMPWSSMRQWIREGDFLFVQFRHDQYAVIASTDSSGAPIDLDEIAGLLIERGVRERN